MWYINMPNCSLWRRCLNSTLLYFSWKFRQSASDCYKHTENKVMFWQFQGSVHKTKLLVFSLRLSDSSLWYSTLHLVCVCVWLVTKVTRMALLLIALSKHVLSIDCLINKRIQRLNAMWLFNSHTNVTCCMALLLIASSKRVLSINNNHIQKLNDQWL